MLSLGYLTSLPAGEYRDLKPLGFEADAARDATKLMQASSFLEPAFKQELPNADDIAVDDLDAPCGLDRLHPANVVGRTKPMGPISAGYEGILFDRRAATYHSSRPSDAD